METPVALPAGDMGWRLSLEAPGGATRAAGRLALPPDALTASLAPALVVYSHRAGVAELVDAGDLKSSAAAAASGFESRLRHQRAFARAHLQVDGPMVALA